jgi:hypothetical protein
MKTGRIICRGFDHRKGLLNTLCLLVCLLGIVGTSNFSVQAKPANQWLADRKVPGYLDDTFTPYLIADQNRTVHAFASQWINDGGRRQAIVYRRWSLAGGWTRPVDVLLAPSGDAVFLAAFLDSSGTFHLIFANGEDRNVSVYYASAPANMADSVFGWSTPQLIGWGILEVNAASLSGDGNGNLVVIYSGNQDGNGVYAIHSADAGRSWSDVAPVFLTQDIELLPYSLHLFKSPGDQIRAVWNVVTNRGVDNQLYFASYDILTGAWTRPMELDKRVDVPDYFGPSFPAIVENGQEIVIMYNGGNPFPGLPVPVGRPVQRVIISTNAGRTWIDPGIPFPFHVGRSGEHSLSLDGAGIPHALFVQRIDTEVEGAYSTIGGIWHSAFRAGSWSNPDRFVTTYAPHDVRSIVVQGNVLLVVWRQDPGEGQHGIWYSYSILDAPELPVVPLPTVNPGEMPVANPSDMLTAAIPQNQSTGVPAVVATPTLGLTDQQREILTSTSSPALPFVVGLIPAVVVLIIVIVLYRVIRVRQ